VIAPLITIFVRHSDGCKYAGDEFCKRCNCRKHLRWTQNGVQYRRTAGTRSWERAEEQKRRLEDQLAGRIPTAVETTTGQTVDAAVKLFLQDKTTQGLSSGVLGKYSRELARLRSYCESAGTFTVQAITKELLTGYCATWTELYPSTTTRAKVRERCRSFLRYCFEAQWLPRVPTLPKIKVDEPPTMPLTAQEYKRLLGAIPATFPDTERQSKVRALIQLMRWSGLAIVDALTLERAEIQWDKSKKVHRIVTARQKTGTHVSVPIPANVARELLAVLNGNERYVFWSGEGGKERITKSWTKYMIAPLFKTAKIECEGNMRSHRLRDTFAVDLLEKGVPLEEVSKLLGHESIKTTEKSYAKWVKGRQDRLDSLVMATWSMQPQGS
jgi:integrase/recombinase XerD